MVQWYSGTFLVLTFLCYSLACILSSYPLRKKEEDEDEVEEGKEEEDEKEEEEEEEGEE